MRTGDGLGIAPAVLAIILAGIGGASTILATRLAAGASSPKQKDIERQIRLQHQLDLERRAFEQKQTEQMGKFLLPAVGAFALVMLLR